MNLVSFDYSNAGAICNLMVKECQIYKTYHPEGVIRPTPSNADNETGFVFDYFIKDYLGNVRVVVTEENAVFTQKFLTTLEEAHRAIEEENFDNVGETADDLPLGYPVNGSVALNEKIALLSTANGTEIGPSIVMPVKRGDKVSLKTDYFYTEDAPGASYGNLDMLVNEVLLALAASGSGILRLSEGQLMDIASGTAGYNDVVTSFFSNSFDTTDVSRPHAYLVWMMYDNNMNLIEQGSGVRRVTNPNSLEQLLRDEIPIAADGYLHAYVSNGSVPHVSFDNFMLTYLRGNTRQINHYYPYGLSIDGLDHSDEYLNKYTSKELQTGEFSFKTTEGLEMFDYSRSCLFFKGAHETATLSFGARFYDPQIGRWTTPDPAEQFANPYLAMGNNPVMYVDPDGEFIIAAVGIGLALGAISGYSAGKAQGATGQDLLGYTLLSGFIGGATGIIGAGAGAGVAAGFAPGANLATVGATSGAVGGFAGGSLSGMGTSLMNGASFENSLYAGALSGITAAAGSAIIGGISGAIAQTKLDKFNQSLDKLLTSADDQFYYNNLIADARKSGILINSYEFPKVNFSSDDVVGDMIRQMKMIKVSGDYKTYGDWFDANTISKSEGWNISGSGTGGFGWRKNFTWNGNSVQVYAAPASAHPTKLYGFSEGNTALGRQFGLVGVNKGYLTFLNFQSRLQFDAVSNSIMSAWAPGYRHVPIIIKP